jgi:hypothetical protein
MGLDLSIGGPSWSGWYLGPWGRAKEWRLFDPAGTFYFSDEIANLHHLTRNLNYLEVKLKELERYDTGDAMHFGPEDAATLLAAAAILEKAKKQLSIARRVRAGVLRPP